MNRSHEEVRVPQAYKSKFILNSWSSFQPLLYVTCTVAEARNVLTDECKEKRKKKKRNYPFPCQHFPPKHSGH